VQLNWLFRDLRERKQAEEALQGAQEYLMIAVEAAQMGTWYLDLTQDVSPQRSLRHDQIFGYDTLQTEWGQEICKQHVVAADQEILDAAFARAMETGELNFEVRIRWLDGSIHWMGVSGRFYFDENGTPLYGGGVNFDITDRKLTEQKIQEQAALLDIASNAIFVCDLDHYILYWNQGAERLYGWSALEAIGQLAHELLQNDVAQVAEIMQPLLARGEWRGEVRKVTKTGQEVIVETHWTVVRDEAGQPTSILSVDTDITEKKRLEAQFYQAQRLESIGTLASGIAHDLNNVLTPILAMSIGDRLSRREKSQVPCWERSQIEFG
jgi:PAS domain S-box-containing protein